MGTASPDAAIGLEQPENLDRYRIKTANLADLELSFPTGAQHTFLGGQPPAESSGFFTSIGYVRLRAPFYGRVARSYTRPFGGNLRADLGPC